MIRADDVKHDIAELSREGLGAVVRIERAAAVVLLEMLAQLPVTRDGFHYGPKDLVFRRYESHRGRVLVDRITGADAIQGNWPVFSTEAAARGF